MVSVSIVRRFHSFASSKRWKTTRCQQQQSQQQQQPNSQTLSMAQSTTKNTHFVYWNFHRWGLRPNWCARVRRWCRQFLALIFCPTWKYRMNYDDDFSNTKITKGAEAPQRVRESESNWWKAKTRTNANNNELFGADFRLNKKKTIHRLHTRENMKEKMPKNEWSDDEMFHIILFHVSRQASRILYIFIEREWNDEKNAKVFHLCRRLTWHQRRTLRFRVLFFAMVSLLASSLIASDVSANTNTHTNTDTKCEA